MQAGVAEAGAGEAEEGREGEDEGLAEGSAEAGEGAEAACRSLADGAVQARGVEGVAASVVAEAASARAAGAAADDSSHQACRTARHAPKFSAKRAPAEGCVMLRVGPRGRARDSSRSQRSSQQQERALLVHLQFMLRKPGVHRASEGALPRQMRAMLRAAASSAAAL